MSIRLSKMRDIKILVALLLFACANQLFSQSKSIDVILMGGQSNATGQGYLKNIPADFKADKSVLFYYSKWLKGQGEAAKWIPLSNASGSKDKFGAELSLGTEYKRLNPDRPLAIIKHALSGSNLYAQWNPGADNTDHKQQGEEYKKFVETVDDALKQLQELGYKPEIKAMTWQQGEADARDIAGMERSRAYGKNLQHFIHRVREQFHAPDMLFVYGYVIPVDQPRFTGRKEVRQAQFDVSQFSGHALATKGAILVQSDDLPLRCVEPGVNMPGDKVHFNTKAQIELGRRYANAIAGNKQSAEVFARKQSQWHGFKRYDFEFQGRSARVVAPAVALEGKPWVWRARFPDWHFETDSILLSEGFHIAYINTNNLFGNDEAMKAWDQFYDLLTTQHRLSKKVALEGVSRGGLFVHRWAKENPEKVSCIYAEAPVCDFTSWPGGFGSGMGSKADWKRLKQEYNFSSDQAAKDYNNLPIHKLENLAKYKVPIMHMIGLNDKVVPPAENSFVLMERYVKLGGPTSIVPCTDGKQTLHGHHFPIESPRLVADFIMGNTWIPKELSKVQYAHQLRGGMRNSLMKFEREKKGRVAFLGGSITYNGGWRDSICAYLQKRFPDTDFEFIAAGIPSMGTTPAAFRLQRDVLSKGSIDLLFEEAAVNDASNGRSNLEQVRAMEGIVRHLREVNPETDIVLMHFVDPDKMATYRRGEVPMVIQNHEAVARHYNIPSINLAKEVTERIDAGEFTWENDFKNLHPSPFGQGVYARSMLAFLDKAWAGFVAEDDKVSMYPMPAPLDPDNYNKGELVLAKEAKLASGWTMLNKWKPQDGKGGRANYVKVPMLVAEGESGSLQFKFEGRAVGIAVAAGPDAGIIEYAIDGGEWQQQDLFTNWSMHLHLPWYYTLATGLDNKKHTLKIRLAKEANKQSTGNACRIRYFFVNR